jgi:hypothetical protein
MAGHQDVGGQTPVTQGERAAGAARSGFGTGDTIDATNFLFSGTTFTFAENSDRSPAFGFPAQRSHAGRLRFGPRPAPSDRAPPTPTETASSRISPVVLAARSTGSALAHRARAQDVKRRIYNGAYLPVSQEIR